MQDEITLAGKVFKRKEKGSNLLHLQGKYEGAFYLNIKEEEKVLDVCMIMGCSCCGGQGVRNVESLQIDLCEGKPCMPKENWCKYMEEGECEEGTAPIDKYWDEMAADAKKQFPDWKIEQSA